MKRGIINKSIKKCLVVIGFFLCLCLIGRYSVSSRASVSTPEERLKELRNKTLSKTLEIKNESSKSVRTIVVLENEPIIENSAIVTDNSFKYTSKIKSKEKDILNDQENIIKKVEKITNNKVVNQTAFLVNSFSIDATKKQMKEIEKIKGVSYVYEASTYETKMTDAINFSKANEVWNDINTGYTGEGIVVAVIDTGVNYEHKDMVLNHNVKTKFTKEQWEDKIELLGYGKYCSDKVPFGYDYATGVDECLNTRSFHGYHVAGIVGANGMIEGVAKNAQVIGIKVLGNDGVGTTDDIIKGIEDSVKLGADIINMSLGYKCSVKSDEDFLQEAINKANASGVMCCIAAGNDGTSASTGDNMNKIGTIDTASVGSPSISKGSLCVASVDNIGDEVDENTPIDVENNVVMSSFSSWGPANDLSIKPEISAPGGNINSLYDGWTSYVELSGTSMATPYIAGCEALVLNSVKNKNLNLKKDELTTYLKANLMNTAKVIKEKQSNNPYSVRYQGSGLVDVKAAVDNNVIALCNNEPKIELGEINNSKKVTVVLKNYGNEDVSYVINKGELYRDFRNKENGAYYIEKLNNVFYNSDVSEVIVPAKNEVSVEISINIDDILNHDEYKDMFIEGFVRFEGINTASLSMPLLGFYGDWSKETIIDTSVYSQEQSILDNVNNITDSRTKTGLVGICNGETDTYLGKNNDIFNGDINAFSPNNDGIRDGVAPIVTAIRSPEIVEINVLDKDMNLIRKVATCTNLKKICQFPKGNKASPVLMKSLFNKEYLMWDGKLYNKSSGKYEVAKDGQYYIQLVSKMTDTSQAQTIIMPVKVDTEVPVLDYINWQGENEKTLSFKLSDNIAISPYLYVDLSKDQKGSSKAYKLGKDVILDENGNYTLNLGNVEDKKVTVMWEDEAGNEIFKIFNTSEDNDDNISDSDFTNQDEDFDSINNEHLSENTDINKPGIKVLENETIEHIADCRMIGKYILLYKSESTNVTFDIKVQDENLKENGLSVIAGVLTKDGDKESTFINEYSKSIIQSSFIGDGTYRICVDMDDNEEELIISATDKDGNVTLKGVHLHNSKVKENFNRRISVNGIMHKLNLDNTLITKDMLNQDGTFTVIGQLNTKPEEVKLNNIDMIIDDETMCFKENININKGCTKVNFSIKQGYSSNEFFTNLYYDDINICINNTDKNSDIITTDNDTYNVSGYINSYISLGEININGDNVYTGVNGRISRDGKLISKNFSEKIELVEGENIITIEVTNAVGHKCSKVLKVYKIS